jgi:hypothetical protein
MWNHSSRESINKTTITTNKIYKSLQNLLFDKSIVNKFFFLQNQSKVKIVPNKFYNSNSNIINLRNKKISKCGNLW